MEKKKFCFQKELRQLLRPYRFRIVSLCVLTVLYSLMQVAMTLLTRNVIDMVLSGSSELGMWIIAFAVNIVIQILVSAVMSWYSGSTTDRFVARLRFRLLRCAMHSANARLEEYHSGELLSRGMDDVYAICDGMIYALPSIVGQLTRLGAAFAVVLWIYPGIAGIMVLAAVAIFVGVACLRPVLKAQHRAVRNADEQVVAAMQENLQQLELIQSLGVRENILHRFNKRLKASLKAKFKRRVWSVGTNSILSVVSLFGSGLLMLWGALNVAAGKLSYGSLTSMLQLVGLLSAPILGLSGLWTRFTAIEVAGERLSVLLELPDRVVEHPQVSAKAVVFENVTFRYAGEEVPVLENFSIRFPLDGWSCLTGVSGRGKSTLFKLILGLHSPEQGRVYLETEQGDMLCTEATRHLFAYVPQDYALFSGTVLENLQLVAPEADEAQRKQALEIAEATFVLDMAAGENTVLRENNAGLSKGQIQRLAIARAVLMDRPVFLLDECTSALDAETEAAVLRNLHTLHKNAIVVTHRPEALEGLDDIHFVSMEE